MNSVYLLLVTDPDYDDEPPRVFRTRANAVDAWHEALQDVLESEGIDIAELAEYVLGDHFSSPAGVHVCIEEVEIE